MTFDGSRARCRGNLRTTGRAGKTDGQHVQEPGLIREDTRRDTKVCVRFVSLRGSAAEAGADAIIVQDVGIGLAL